MVRFDAESRYCIQEHIHFRPFQSHRQWANLRLAKITGAKITLYTPGVTMVHKHKENQGLKKQLNGGGGGSTDESIPWGSGLEHVLSQYPSLS